MFCPMTSMRRSPHVLKWFVWNSIYPSSTAYPGPDKCKLVSTVYTSYAVVLPQVPPKSWSLPRLAIICRSLPFSCTSPKSTDKKKRIYRLKIAKRDDNQSVCRQQFISLKMSHRPQWGLVSKVSCLSELLSCQYSDLHLQDSCEKLCHNVIL